MPDVDDLPDLDQYTHTVVLLTQKCDNIQASRVIGGDSDTNENIICKYAANPILNTQVYESMLPDGLIEQYYANLIYDCENTGILTLL